MPQRWDRKCAATKSPRLHPGKASRNGLKENFLMSSYQPATLFATTLPRLVTGREVSRLRTKAARARLAADLHTGRAALIDPTLEQAAAICAVNTQYISLTK